MVFKFQIHKRHNKNTQTDREFQTLSKPIVTFKKFSHRIDKFKKAISKRRTIVIFGTGRLKRCSF